MLMKLTPGVNFIIIFCALFSYDSVFCRQNVAREKHFHIQKERAQKTLMKLTPVESFKGIQSPFGRRQNSC